MSPPQDMFSNFSLKRNDVKNNSENPGSDSGTSYEVFRNNTTAVEVVVKDVFKGKQTTPEHDTKIPKLQAEIQRLKKELERENKTLLKTRKSFQAIVLAMRKQFVLVNAKETDSQVSKMNLQLENEKLKIALDSKTKLVCKMKKEMNTMKRVLKFVIKSISNAPEIPENSIDSEPDYENFETDLKKNVKVKFLKQDLTETLDSTMSKDYYFD